jgi:TatD DNase family protein
VIDTHCHINIMINTAFDIPLHGAYKKEVENILASARSAGVNTIINVGTNKIESLNCITLAKEFDAIHATVGIHPNDCTSEWKDDFKELALLTKNHEQNKIVGIGECGVDKHYEYNLQRQYDAFKAQIELALTYDLALVVHSRDAYDETLRVLEEYKNQIRRGIVHCFSYDQEFAQTVIGWNFSLGIGGTISYPKNETLRSVVQNTSLEHMVLETDAPYLPLQNMRGKKNHPQYIADIAKYVASLKNVLPDEVGQVTTQNAQKIFKII